MAGLALALDLLRTTAANTKSLHSFSSLSAVSAALSASVGITFLPSYPIYSHQFEPRDWAGQFAICEEAGDPDAAWKESWEESDPPSSSQSGLNQEGVPMKTYGVELKPLFSAFRPKALGATTVRALLVNFLPLLEAYIQPEEDDPDEDSERPASPALDPALSLKRTGTHIMREVAVITTRRVLERTAVHYASPRMAWKLLKDIPKSALRKAGREASKWHIFLRVTKTTFRGHALGVTATWVVQLVLDVSRYLHISIYPKKKTKAVKQEMQDSKKELNMLLRKTAGSTLKGGASLILASVGAGLGTILIKPSVGTWIGCAAGDLAGPYLIGIWLDAWIFYGTFSPPSDDL